MNEVDEAATLIDRARALDEEIAKTKRRIRLLQGLDEGAARREAGSSKHLVEVERELPALEVPEAYERLTEALYDRLGVIGAVRTSPTSFEWSAVSNAPANQLEVKVSDAESDAPRLTVRGPRYGRASLKIALAVVLGLATMIGLGLAIAAHSVLAMVAVLASMLVAGVFVMKQITSSEANKELAALAGSLAEVLPVRGARVRVAVAERASIGEDTGEEAQAEAELVEAVQSGEVARGLP